MKHDIIALSHFVQSPLCHVKELVVDSLWSHDEQILPKSEIEFLQAIASCNSLRILQYGTPNASHDVLAALAHLVTHHTTLSEVVVQVPGDSIEDVLLLLRRCEGQQHSSSRTLFAYRYNI